MGVGLGGIAPVKCRGIRKNGMNLSKKSYLFYLIYIILLT